MVFSGIIRNIITSIHCVNEIEKNQTNEQQTPLKVWLINSHTVFFQSSVEEFRLKAGSAEVTYLNHGEAQPDSNM